MDEVTITHTHVHQYTSILTVKQHVSVHMKLAMDLNWKHHTKLVDKLKQTVFNFNVLILHVVNKILLQNSRKMSENRMDSKG